uniref:Uncharacterized protein n=1 Tax=Hyaloperonospora arabidopsidis (strain Emoy2) TaxID=559515 RepID=M4BWJ1_HYAAE
MGNFLVSTVCSAHSRSEAAYAIVKAQVSALRGCQPCASPLQRRCAAQQAALLRALASKMALTATATSDWAAAAVDQAGKVLVTFLVLAAQKLLASTRPPLALSHSDEDDVLDEFNAVFETTRRSEETMRALHDSDKCRTELIGGMSETGEKEVRDNHRNKRRDGTRMIRSSDLDDEFVLLPKMEEDRGFYVVGLDGNEEEQYDDDDDGGCPTEGERLLQLASSIATTSLHVEQFLPGGNFEKAEAVAKDVDELAAAASESEKKSIVRVLLAYCAYSRDWNYSSDMVVTASEYLRVWQGDEDRAFKSLAVLCNDVPRLCAAFE